MEQTRKKMIPIGVENFAEMSQEGFYYVDKTGLIKELLDEACEVSLFTRPRRFGKSLNLDMLKIFLRKVQTATYLRVWKF